MKPFRICLAAAALAAAAPVAAEVYRWVDDRGVVNYASQPPANARNVVRLDLRESRISVIPLATPAPAPPGARRPAPAGFPGAIDDATIAAVEPANGWRERCFAERRVDCTSPTAATYDYAPAYATAPPYDYVPRARITR